MSAPGGPNHKGSVGGVYFKKGNKSVPGSIKPVYGAQHPPMQSKPASMPTTPTKKGSKSNDSFRDYENKTSDAWDDGDDDLVTMANVQLSMKDVESTALTVLHNHSQSQHRLPTNGASNRGGGTAGSSPPRSQQHHHAHTGPGIGVRLAQHTRNDVPKTHVRLAQMPVPDREASKLDKFQSVLSTPNMNLDELAKLSWSGIPKAVRPVTWKILSGYLPGSIDRRDPTLQRKRKEYFGFIEQYFDTRHSEPHANTFRQIQKDCNRMVNVLELTREKTVQEIFERVLFIWAIRHPASGYVQGMNDLVTPFFVVFLTEWIENDIETENADLNELPKEKLEEIEADSFWCMSKLLDGIQDCYTFAQPGIQLKVNRLQELIKRIDAPLHAHLMNNHVEYLQFAFRWMNNLLMREMPLRCIIRLWDTYLAEPEGFSAFHLYVCAALICRFSQEIKSEKDFQGIMMFLQNLPTHHWQNQDIGLLLAEAYKLKYMFADAPQHLRKQ
ncbi:TBC1 domain family member 22A-like isoform X2 [Lingula anatina]|uniref:TBC1 domain family member 22A-like isoform X2 n=1 Tax=Lingula anatina TaxID=7574 RepID=A0A1S3H773_LINAN|nr:TBC1 domain family member 22A-like isoform X2 [Lingula anatina]|eukprot:XP_013381331.1 TBC1 domain family member 22A-like isoform X2 [Lingula anatina]